MKTLRDILYKAGMQELSGDLSRQVASVCFDSRQVQKDTLFIAVRGLSSDGHSFINAAIEKGASAVVLEEMPAEIKADVTYVKVKDSSVALAYICANFYEHPSQKIKLIGVTGTNGKTTTVTLLHSLYRELGYKAGLLSTVRN